MAKDPAFLFYTSDFLTGTIMMDMTERGQYITILCLLHQHGGFLPMEQLEFVVGKISSRLLVKFEVNEKNELFNKRLLQETTKRQAFCQSRRENIQKRYKKATYEGTSVQHMENENENEDEIVNRDVKRKEKRVPTHPPFVYIEEQDLRAFYRDYGKTVINEYIQKINDYLSSTGKKPYKDYPATLRNWLRKDQIKKKPPELKPMERPPEITEEQRQENMRMITELKTKIGGR